MIVKLFFYDNIVGVLTNIKTPTLQTISKKYHITENISIGVNVRAINFMLAEYLEFNFG